MGAEYKEPLRLDELYPASKRIGHRTLLSPAGALVIAAFSAFFLISSSSRPAIDSHPAVRLSAARIARDRSTPSEIVVVMTWDGVRWQEIINGIDPSLANKSIRQQFEGREASSLLPHLHRIARSGSVLLGGEAALMRASSPSTVSLPGYSEIFSGRTPTCTNNDCGHTKQDTLLDQWRTSRPSAKLAVITSWERIPRVAAKDPSSIDISAGRLFVQGRNAFCDAPGLCGLLDDARNLSPWPGGEDYRPDRATAAVALAYLRAHQPQFAFVGLGDTDEYAHHGDYAGYLRALQYADEVLGAVHHWLLEKERQGHRTLLIVTADHGRASGFFQHTRAPEAARVWALISGSGVTARARPLTTNARLADIAPTIRDFVKLERDPHSTAGTSWASSLLDEPSLTSDERLANHAQ